MEEKDQIRLRRYQCKKTDELPLEDLLGYIALLIDSLDELLLAIRTNYPGNPLILQMLTAKAAKEHLAEQKN